MGGVRGPIDAEHEEQQLTPGSAPGESSRRTTPDTRESASREAYLRASGEKLRRETRPRAEAGRAARTQPAKATEPPRPPLPPRQTEHAHEDPAVKPRETDEGMAEVVLGLLRHARIPWLEKHYGRAPVLALFSILAALTSIGIIAGIAALTGTPLIIPSLGPTAFLFFYSPRAPAASPRHAIVGQFIGVSAGYVGLLITNYHLGGIAGQARINWAAVLSAGIALTLTMGLMVLLHVEHPPAAATALIIALGALREPYRLVLLMVAVLLLVGQAIVINRLAGVDYPLWAARPVPCPPESTVERPERE